MLTYWRLSKNDGDFVLVRSPSFLDVPLVRHLHLELLSRVRGIEGISELEYDIPLFEKLGNYYQQLGKELGFDPKEITSESRHRFFIAAEPRGGFWISGLELLMGYDFNQEGGIAPLITSGEYEIDLLAEICLCVPPGIIEFLIKNYSSNYLSKLTYQISQRMRGKEAIEEAQREKDKEFMRSLEKEMEEAGWQI